MNTIVLLIGYFLFGFFVFAGPSIYRFYIKPYLAEKRLYRSDPRFRSKKVHERVRAHLEWFGIDVSNLSDKELEEGHLEAWKILGESRITAREAAMLLSNISRK